MHELLLTLLLMYFISRLVIFGGKSCRAMFYIHHLKASSNSSQIVSRFKLQLDVSVIIVPGIKMKFSKIGNHLFQNYSSRLIETHCFAASAGIMP